MDDLRGRSAAPATHKLIGLADFIAESKISGSLAAQSRRCELVVSAVDAGLAIDADQAMLFSAVGQLLDNAVRFTLHHGKIRLSAYAAGDRIHIDIEDACGGLAAGDEAKMLLPAAPNGAEPEDRGLSMCHRSVQANNGLLSVRDVPGCGCVFTIDLPRHALPAAV
jgi:signal transduction histidine kinase